MPIRNGLPSPAMILFNTLIRGLLFKINEVPLININDEENYNAMKQRQQWADKHDTQNDFTIIAVGSTVTVGTIVEHDTKKHNNRSYNIHVMKMGHIITSTA